VDPVELPHPIGPPTVTELVRLKLGRGSSVHPTQPARCFGSVNDAVVAIRAGAREYLTKPFEIERLVEVV